VVALYVARSAQQIKLRGYCGHRLIVGGGMPQVEVFSIHVSNVSQRPTVVTNISLRCGLFKSKKQGIITMMASSISHGIPKPLADGDTAQWSVELGNDQAWFVDLIEKFEMDWLAIQTLKFGVHTSNGGTTYFRPERETRRMLLDIVETRRHG
jgi:hypothetical protein